MSYVDELKYKHEEMGVTKYHVTLGDGNPTQEQVAREMLSGIWQMERGHSITCPPTSPNAKWEYKIKYKVAELRSWLNITKDKLLGIKNPYKD